VEVNGLQVSVGGDVVVEADGGPIADFADLLVAVAFKNVGDTIELTVLRNGQRRQIVVALIPRPSESDR
jgi:S1-C subfamily serine protease